MDKEQQEFLESYKVSHETIHSLSTYQRMLVEWNERFNLVSASTLPQIWTRHFADSAQLMEFIPGKAKFLADMGSGAGFPGLVLAIMTQGAKKPLHITLIESTGKKADFLQAVVDALKLDVTVRRDRVENIRDLKADVVTARALKALPELLVYANYLMHKDTTCIFPKGKNAAEELTEAKKKWIFSDKSHQSRTDDSGRVLVLNDIHYKKRH